MSDEIYVNTGGTFQQPFNDRQPSNAQQPYIANAQNMTTNGIILQPNISKQII